MPDKKRDATGEPRKDHPAKPETAMTESISVVEETATASARQVETGQVRVSLRTETVSERLEQVLRGRRVEVERVAIGRVLAEDEAPPTTREEGDTLVIPVLEETAVVVTRLVLREEVRLRLLTEETPFEEEVALRRQVAIVERLPPASPQGDTQTAEGHTP